MRIVEIVRAVFIRGIGRPHETADAPVEIARPQNLAFVVPIHHVVGGKDVIRVHEIAAARREHIMGRIYVDFVVALPHMCGGIGGEQRGNDGIARFFERVQIVGQFQPIDVEITALHIEPQRLLAGGQHQRARIEGLINLPTAGRRHIALRQSRRAFFHINRTAVVGRGQPQLQPIGARRLHMDGVLQPVALMGVPDILPAADVAAILRLYAEHEVVILRFDADGGRTDRGRRLRAVRRRTLHRLARVGAANMARRADIHQFKPIEVAVAALKIEPQRLLACQQCKGFTLVVRIELPIAGGAHRDRRLGDPQFLHRDQPGRVGRCRAQHQLIAAGRRHIQRVIHPVALIGVPDVLSAVRIAAAFHLYTAHFGEVLRLHTGRTAADGDNRCRAACRNQFKPIEVAAALHDVQRQRLLARRQCEAAAREAIPRLPAAGVADRHGGQRRPRRVLQLHTAAVVGRRRPQTQRICTRARHIHRIGGVVAGVDKAEFLTAVLAALDLHADHLVIAFRLHANAQLFYPCRTALIHPRRVDIVIEIRDGIGVEHVRHRDIMFVVVEQLLAAVGMEHRVDKVHPRPCRRIAEVFDKIEEIAVIQVQCAVVCAHKALGTAPAGDIIHIHRAGAAVGENDMIGVCGIHIVLCQRHDLGVDKRHTADRLNAKGGNTRIHALTENPTVRQTVAAGAGFADQADAVAAGEGEVVETHLLLGVADGEHLGVVVQPLLDRLLSCGIRGRIGPRAVFGFVAVVQATVVDLHVADHAARRAAADLEVVFQRDARKIFHVMMVAAVGHQVHAVIRVAQRHVDDIHIFARAAHTIGIRGGIGVILLRLVKHDAADTAVRLQRHGGRAVRIARAAVHLKNRAELDRVATDIHRTLQLHAGGDGQRAVQPIMTGREEHHAAAFAARLVQRRLDDSGHIAVAGRVRTHHIQVLPRRFAGVIIRKIRDIRDGRHVHRLIVHGNLAVGRAGQLHTAVERAAGENRVHAVVAQRHLRAGGVERTACEGGHAVVEIRHTAVEGGVGHRQVNVSIVIHGIGGRMNVDIHHLQQTVRILGIPLDIDTVFAVVDLHRRDRLAAGTHAGGIDAVSAVLQCQRIALPVGRAAGVDGRLAETQSLPIAGDIGIGQVRPVDTTERHAGGVVIQIIRIRRVVGGRRACQPRVHPVLRRKIEEVEATHVHDAVHVYAHFQRRAVDIAQRRANGHLSARNRGGYDADVGIDQRNILDMHVIRAPHGGIAHADGGRIRHDI